MDVFAYYDCSLGAPEVQAEWVPLWERSWRARGWNPRLITARHARRSKFYALDYPPEVMPFLALHAVGGEWLSSLRVINFSFDTHRARRGVREHCGPVIEASKSDLHKMLRTRRISMVYDRKHSCKYNTGHGGCCKYNLESWSNFPLVYFPDPDPGIVLDCGRSF